MISLNNSYCDQCKLNKTRHCVINGAGPENARILLVGDGPSVGDDKVGKLYSTGWGAESGKILNKILSKAGINRWDVFTTSMIRCVAKHPETRGTRPATPEEVLACSSYLDAEIAAIKPNVIVPMGDNATRHFLNMKKGAVSKFRGIETWSDKYQCKIIPTYAPEALVKVPKFESVMVQDFINISKSSFFPEMTKKVATTYMTIDTIELFDEVMERLMTAERVAFDLETTGLDFTRHRILCAAFSWAEKTGVVVPLTRYVPRKVVHEETIMKPIKKKINGVMTPVGMKPIPKIWTETIDEYENYWGDKQDYVKQRLAEFFSSQVQKIAHNGKFDVKFLKRANFDVREFNFDTMLAHFLLDENAEGLHGLKDNAVMFTDMGHYEKPLEQWFKDRKIKEENRNYAHLPTEMLYEYACMDVDCTMRLYNLYAPRIKAEGLATFMDKLIVPLVDTLMEAEYQGVQIDVEYAKQTGEEIKAHIALLEAEMIAKVGVMNFSSDDQLADLFFNKLKLPPQRKTDSGAYSTDESVLTVLATLHPVPKLLLEFRGLNKLLGTYIEGLLERLDEWGRIHTDFLIHGAVTGRLSSRGPNLQNIPRKDKDHPESFTNRIKNFFIPRPGYVFIEADYGQAEFRHWANYSQDPAMLLDLRNGVDIHRQTAANLYKIPQDQVTTEQRQAAKSIVFGLMFGMQLPHLIADVLELYKIVLTEQQGQQVINDFFARYPKAELWLKNAIYTVKRDKQIRNVFGRLRRLPGIDSTNGYMRSESERQATNSPIQSAASDMNCNAANRLRFIFSDMGMDARLCLLVHDSLLFEVPEGQALECAQIIRREMIKPIQGVTAPMIAELKMGPKWGTLSALCAECCKPLVKGDKDICVECKNLKLVGATQ